MFEDINMAALIGTLDTGSDGFFVGVEQTYLCPFAGNLLLGINDRILEGNRGEFSAIVALLPAG